MRQPRPRRGLPGVQDDRVRQRAGARGQGRGGRPRGSTRERILDVALDLFTDQGYEQTSMREVADALGFTKAALYYHFQNKEDILLSLHMRMHALGSSSLEQLEQLSDAGAGIEAWVAVLDEFVDRVLENRKLFLFHLRNDKALEQLQQTEHHETEHGDLQEQLQRVLRAPYMPLPLRVRMACSIGAVMGLFMGTSAAFADIPAGELAELVRDAIRDLMAVGAPATQGASRRRQATRREPSRREPTRRPRRA